MAMESGIDTSKWDAFWARWGSVIAQVPDAKRRMLEEIGGQLTESVRRQIIARGVNDQYGRVQSWQESRVGTGRGYVAVSPAKGNTIVSNSSATAGAVTNYLETGHPIREPSGRSRRYRPEIHTTRVRAFGFYRAAQPDAEKIGQSAAEAFMQRLEEKLK